MTTPLGEFTVIVITGPTGSGKSNLAVSLAQHLKCHILSADSRQIYRDIPIGTAAPTPQQLAAVPHHLVGTLPLQAYYSAACFESDALDLIHTLAEQGQHHLVVCGGSMMYIDALTRGIDPLPTISAQVREHVGTLLSSEGPRGLIGQLRKIDPAILTIIDTKNPKRLAHALEICLEAGRPYSTLRTGNIVKRPFRILQFHINLPRPELFHRINARVDQMMEQGFEQEALKVFPLRHLNSLNTVGFKEMFALFQNRTDRPTAIQRMAKNTRVYAKKQLTWLKKRPEILPLSPQSALQTIISHLNSPQPEPSPLGANA